MKKVTQYQDVVEACGGTYRDADIEIARVALGYPPRYMPDWDWRDIVANFYVPTRSMPYMLDAIMKKLEIDF